MSGILQPNGDPARKLVLFKPNGETVPLHPPKPHQLQVSGEGEDQQYRWLRNDGKARSPVFTSLQEALYYAATVPLMTRDEWQQLEVPPEWLALNEVQSEEPPTA
jgi:hypothetical protein